MLTDNQFETIIYNSLKTLKPNYNESDIKQRDEYEFDLRVARIVLIVLKEYQEVICADKDF